MIPDTLFLSYSTCCAQTGIQTDSHVEWYILLRYITANKFLIIENQSNYIYSYERSYETL